MHTMFFADEMGRASWPSIRRPWPSPPTYSRMLARSGR